MIMPSSQPIAVIRGLPTHLGGGWTRSADVVIHPGRLCLVIRRQLVTRPLDGAVFTHSGGPVNVTLAAFPPGSNTALLVDHEQGRAVVSLPGWKRRALLNGLHASGLEVRTVRTWTVTPAWHQTKWIPKQ